MKKLTFALIASLAPLAASHAHAADAQPTYNQAKATWMYADGRTVTITSTKSDYTSATIGSCSKRYQMNSPWIFVGRENYVGLTYAEARVEKASAETWPTRHWHTLSSSNAWSSELTGVIVSTNVEKRSRSYTSSSYLRLGGGTTRDVIKFEFLKNQGGYSTTCSRVFSWHQSLNIG